MTVRVCPICKKPGAEDYRPFCSRRCADVDLQRWLTGRYALDGEHEDDLDALWPEAPDGAPTRS